jgi:hypothetical protein
VRWLLKVTRRVEGVTRLREWRVHPLQLTLVVLLVYVRNRTNEERAGQFSREGL